MRKAGMLLLVPFLIGCEITASIGVQKEWNTDPHLYKNNDLKTTAEVKVNKLMGAEARRKHAQDVLKKP